jgi:hypothetical protein
MSKQSLKNNEITFVKGAECTLYGQNIKFGPSY